MRSGRFIVIMQRLRDGECYVRVVLNHELRAGVGRDHNQPTTLVLYLSYDDRDLDCVVQANNTNLQECYICTETRVKNLVNCELDSRQRRFGTNKSKKNKLQESWLLIKFLTRPTVA